MDIVNNKEKNAEFRKRAAELVAQMTLEEKVGQTLNWAPDIDRLGIKKYNWWNEALHGVARAGVATVFPQAIGLAAKIKLVEPKTIERSMGKAVHVIDKRKLV